MQQDRGIFAQHFLEILARELQKLASGRQPHGGRARLAGEHAAFSEHLAAAQYRGHGFLPFARVDDANLARDDDVERVALVALREQKRVLRQGEGLQARGDPS